MNQLQHFLVFPVPTPTPPNENLPSLLKKFFDNVGALTGAHPSIITNAIFSGLSAAVAPHVDVKNPLGNVEPTSLMTFTIAGSGSGKTAVSNLVFKPFHDFDAEQRRKFSEAEKEFEFRMSVWTAVSKGLTRKLTKDTIVGVDAAAETTKAIKEHGQEPKAPTLQMYICTKMTVSGFKKMIEGDRGSIFVAPDEGSTMLDGLIEISTNLNEVWSGQSTLFPRVHGGPLIATNARVTMNIPAQPGIMTPFVKKNGDVLRSSGLLARMLVACVLDWVAVPDLDREGAEEPAIAEWHKLISKLLAWRCSPGQKPIVLEFDEYAKIRWKNYAREFAQLCYPGQFLADIRDVAAKAMSNISRIAALLHFVIYGECMITVESLERAYFIVWHHIHEFKRIFATPQVVYDAQALESFFHRRFLESGVLSYLQSDLLRVVPYEIRNKARLSPAIYKLEAEGKVWISVDQGRAIVNLSEAYFASLPRF